MVSIQEQMGKIMGDAIARGSDRWHIRKMELLMLEFQLLGLELDLFLAGGPIPSESEKNGQ